MEAQTAEQQNWNNDPQNQPRDHKSIEKTNPNTNKELHPAIESSDDKKESGKDIGIRGAPVISINPTSGSAKGDNEKREEVRVFDNANRFINHVGVVHDFFYPFDKMENGQAFFVPVEKNSSTDKLVAHLHDQIFKFLQQVSECEKDEKGDDVWESVVIQTKKRTTDGYIQLDGFNKPIVGANQTNRPKLIHAANFIVKPVVKGDSLTMDEDGTKAETDGALVICVM